MLRSYLIITSLLTKGQRFARSLRDATNATKKMLKKSIKGLLFWHIALIALFKGISPLEVSDEALIWISSKGPSREQALVVFEISRQVQTVPNASKNLELFSQYQQYQQPSNPYWMGFQIKQEECTQQGTFHPLPKYDKTLFHS